MDFSELVTLCEYVNLLNNDRLHNSLGTRIYRVVHEGSKYVVYEINDVLIEGNIIVCYGFLKGLEYCVKNELEW